MMVPKSRFCAILSRPGLLSQVQLQATRFTWRPGTGSTHFSRAGLVLTLLLPGNPGIFLLPSGELTKSY